LGSAQVMKSPPALRLAAFVAAAACAWTMTAFAAPSGDAAAQNAVVAQQLRDAAAERIETLHTVAPYRDLLSNRLMPTVGAPGADVVIVVFSDYLCPLCKASSPALDAEVAKDKGVRLVFLPFPLIGPGSELGVKATFAANLQKRFYPLHRSLMETRGGIDQPKLMRMAAAQGLDMARLSHDMDDPRLEPLKQRTAALAKDLVVLGTPAYLVGGVLVRSEVTEDQLDGVVALDRCLGRAARLGKPATICMDAGG
jgi:protein-disulfide isomerase